MKRLLSLLLCATLVLTGFSVFAEDTILIAKAPSNDVLVVPSENDQYLKILNDLGLTESSNGSDYATRMDFVEMLLKAYGYKTLSAEDTVFVDAKSDDARSGYVKAAYDLGFMGGFSDKYFRPYINIEFNQAVKAVVSMVGYDAYAKVRGGYPAGYLYVANSLGLTSGIDNKNGTSALTIADASRLIYNALTTEIMEIAGIQGDTVIYDKNSGKTLLEDNVEVTMVEGQVTETYLTALGGKSSLDIDEVRVGKKVYTTSVDLLDSLGKNMTFYIQTSEENYGNILSAVDHEDTFEILLDVDSISDIGKKSITYFNENDKEKNLDLSIDTKFIYNGVAKINWSKKDIENASQVRLLDADGDDVCDVIFADKYTNLVVNRLNVEDEVIFFKNSITYPKIQVKDPKKYVLWDNDGNRMNLSDIEIGSVISFTVSEDKALYKMHYSNKTVSGTINELNAPDKKVKIDDTVYSYESEIAKSLVLGDSKVFCIDFRGNIVAIGDDIAQTLKYGYLINTNISSGMETEAQVKIYTTDDEIKIYDLAKRVRIGNEPKNEADAYTAIDKNKEKLIQYSLNANDEVSKVVFAVDGTTLSDEEKFSKFTLDEDMGSETVGYRGGSLSFFAHRHRIDSDTLIFVIPTDLTQEHNFKILKKTTIKDDQTFVQAKFYDDDENYVTKVIVANSGGSGSLDETATSAVISDVIHMIDEMGDRKKVVKLFTGSAEVSYSIAREDIPVYMSNANTDVTKDPLAIANGGTVPSTATFDDLDMGDIVQFSTDENGEISVMSVMLRSKYPSNKEWTSDTKHLVVQDNKRRNNVYSGIYTAYGQVKKSVNGAFSMIIPDSITTPADTLGEFLRVFPVADAFKVIRVDRKNDRVDYVTVASIFEGDNVFIQTRYTATKLVVLYE